MATTLIRLSGRKDIQIKYIGLRPGEKISEDLFFSREDRRATTNPLVTSVDVPNIGVNEVRSLLIGSHQEAAIWMRHESVQSVPVGA